MTKPEDMTWFHGMEVESVAAFHNFLTDAALTEDDIRPGSFITAKWLGGAVLMKVIGGWAMLGKPQPLSIFDACGCESRLSRPDGTCPDCGGYK